MLNLSRGAHAVSSQRASWIPYFDDGDYSCFQKIIEHLNSFSLCPSVQTILFLAPLAFNQMLEENPRISRLVSRLLGLISGKG